MNSEANRSSLSSSSSSDDEEEIGTERQVDDFDDKKSESSKSSASYRSGEVVEPESHSDSDNTSVSSSSSSYSEVKETPDILRNLESKSKETSTKSSTTSTYTNENLENREQQEVIVNEEEHYSDSGSFEKKQSDHESSSIATESDRGLLQSILSDSSSEKIVTDIDVTSPKDGKFSSSTDEELLRKFREQQANRRFRPRSAKLRRDFEPEPESVEKVPSKSREKSSSGDFSSSDFSDEEDTRKRRQHKKPRKTSSSSTSKSSVISKKEESPRSASQSSENSHSSDIDKNPKESKPVPISTSTVIKSKKTNTSTGSETRNTLTTSATSPSSDSESTVQERPPSRQGRRPISANHKQRQKQNTRPHSSKSVQRLLAEKASPLPRPQIYVKGPIEQGFPWPYSEDIKGGEKSLRRLIDYHKKKLNSLLAQEYLQKHLEIELRKAGAQFREYEREPRPLSPKQVRKFKERNITWVYLDGKLHNLSQGMGGMNTTARRGRERNKVSPKKDTKERSKRSVSFEKGAGRSSSRSTEKTSLVDILRGRSGKKNKNAKRRRSSSADTGSRKSSLSSRGSARSPSRSSSRTSQASSVEKKTGKKSRSRSSSKASRSRSSSQSSKLRSLFKKEKSQRNDRPKTAKGTTRARSASSTSVSSRRSSNDSKKSKNKKDKKSRSKSSSSSSKDREKHYRIDEKPKLERVLFTEDMAKRMARKKKKDKSVRIAIAPGIYKTHHPHESDENTPSLGRKGNKVPSEIQSNQPRDDYNFYRDHNIPGHAFPYYYLSYLLAMDGMKRNRSDDYSQTNRVILTHAPIHRGPAWSTPPTRSRRMPARLHSRRSPSSSPKLSKRKKKTKSVINERNDDVATRSSSRESASSSMNRTSNSSYSYPRIRPGSGPIKCSWNSLPPEEKPKFPGSDHQLKNTDNPAILAWLRRKDAQLRARKQNELRKQRKKTSRLIDEQNDLEEKHERALKQYEVWKRAKDREILLRRRQEAMEANSAVFARKQIEIKTRKPKERPKTASMIEQKQSIRSTFSELRSSSASPDLADKSKPRKPRPKSANMAGVSFSNPVVTSNTRPRSATPPRKSDQHSQGVFEKTENFFKSFLGVGESKKSKKQVETDPTSKQSEERDQQQTFAPDDRVAYDKWVRSSTPTSNGSPKRNNGKSKKTRKNKQPRLPPHNHSDNDLISNLAKRRIESILASRKRVDTGLKKRPPSGINGIRNPTPPTGNRTDPAIRKWRLREDDIVKPRIKSSSQNSLGTHSNASSSSSIGENERPKFTFSPKTKSRSTRHHRNPVTRNVLDDQ